ncbi:choice-of-anchor H family protein [Paraglaciecola aestuariivivens]
MKQQLLISVVSLWISSIAIGAEQGSWTTQSSEFQNGKQVRATQLFSSKNSATNELLKSAANSHSNSQEHSLNLLKSRTQDTGLNQEFWVFDAWLTLHQDRDYDGYYHHFSLEIDADTEYASAQLYARLYLGVNEVFQEFHVTDNFTIYGDSSDDSYVIETELLTGFPSNDYEVLIELYDAYTNELVAVYDGYNDADLYLISLESKNYDRAPVVVVHEHGGSLAGWSLVLLLIVGLYRMKNASLA